MIITVAAPMTPRNVAPIMCQEFSVDIIFFSFLRDVIKEGMNFFSVSFRL